MTGRLRGLLIDFSGTIFRLEDRDRWFTMVVSRHGLEVPDPGPAVLAARLERGGGRPGGPEPADLETFPAPLRQAWERRDLSAAEHRGAYTALLRHAGLPWPELADAFYDRAIEPDAWVPYTDTTRLLRRCAAESVPVAVISNIGWHPRPIFRLHGLADTVSAYTLSFEEGRQKPDPAIFELACARIGVRPEEALMIGDSVASDGPAEALGIRTVIIPAGRCVGPEPDPEAAQLLRHGAEALIGVS